MYSKYHPIVADRYFGDEHDSSGADEDEDDYDDEEEDEYSDYDRNLIRSGGHYMTDPNKEYSGIKEQMYQDKLADLKRQLSQLQEGTLPDYVKRLRRLESLHRERMRINDIIRDLEVEMVEQDYVNEKRAAAREFEEHKVYLKDQLITELEDKQKIIESERHNMELSGDATELKTISTRKLRRRANEPSSSNSYTGNDKRRKPVQLASLTYMLEESDILDDLKIINKNKALSKTSHHSGGRGGSSSGMSSHGGSSSPSLLDIRVVDGKLFYQKRWFRRGQSVQVEPKNGEKYPAMISAIGTDAIWVRKLNDNTKARIYITQLTKGKFVLKRRAS